jgi:hypothetical protein
VTAGRQLSSPVAVVGVFDGVSAEISGRRLDVGLLTGTQPDPDDYSHATDIREHGLYVTLHNGPQAARQWSMSTSFIGSYRRSTVDRELLYLQGRYGGPRLWVYATQEIDHNRGWKEDAGEDAVSMTATFASATWRATHRLSLRGGYDGRRNVRLYRDFVNPETEFDDSFRQGTWAGVSTRIAERFTVGIDGRSSDGGTPGRVTAYTLSMGAHRPGRRFGLRTRSTHYESDLETGWLHSATADFQAGRLVQLQLGGGTRREQRVSGAWPDEKLAWINSGVEVSLGRRWYWIAAVDLLRGAEEDVDQYYSRLTYRF